MRINECEKGRCGLERINQVQNCVEIEDAQTAEIVRFMSGE
jgi:hypothetical protein